MAEPGSAEPKGGAESGSAEPKGGAESGSAEPKGGAESGSDEGNGGEDKVGFPEDWRQQIAGDDKKMLDTLSRFLTPSALAKAFVDTRAKLSSGDYKMVLPDDPTDSEVAAWRKENGVPESYEGYEVALPDDAYIDDLDEALIESFKKHAHGDNLNNEAVSSAMNWYNKVVEEQETAQAAMDIQDREECVVELRNEWGEQYRGNLNGIAAQLGPDLEHLLEARFPDGSVVGSDPDVLRFLAGVAVERNPPITLVGNLANNPKAIGERIAELHKMAGNGKSDYWKGPNKDALQEEYRNLLSIQEDERKRG
jgi:hypothetical protein